MSKANISPEFEATLWDAAKAVAEFKPPYLADQTGISRYTVTRAITKWIKSGRIRVVRKEGVSFVYAAVPDEGVAGRLIDAGSARQSVTGNLWIAIRMLRRRFTSLDLVAAASTPEVAITERQAQEYCRVLFQAGVLVAQRKARPGARKATYRLAHDLGPEAPAKKRIDVLHDPNAQAVMHLNGGIRA